jgi:hypothetical protein
VDTTERGDRGAKEKEIGGETQGDFTDNSIANNISSFAILAISNLPLLQFLQFSSPVYIPMMFSSHKS